MNSRLKQPLNLPAAMQDKFAGITSLTDEFCQQVLKSAEYAELTRKLTATLCLKRPSPLLKGRENSWAAGLIHALGMVNFLFDPSQKPHCKSSQIHEFFQISASNMQAKSMEIRRQLDMSQVFSTEWMLESRIDDNPIVWILKVNGCLVDIRNMPLEAQQVAYDKGLIPYIPAFRNDN